MSEELQFNPELVSGNAADHQRLAQDIGTFVQSDLSVPMMPDNRDAWQSDFHLRALEQATGYRARSGSSEAWEYYTDVCRRAMDIVQNPEGKELLHLCVLNGTRRVPDQDWDLVQCIILDAESAIVELQSGSRKERLASLLDYHIGIVARYIGDYERAITDQLRAAERAASSGDYVGEAISLLSAAVENFNLAISEGRETRSLLVPLKNEALKVVAMCTGDESTMVRWRLLSAPVHVLEAHIWGLHQISASDERYWTHLLMDELQTADPEYFAQHEAWRVSIQAGLAYLHNRRTEAYRLANDVETRLRATSNPEAHTTARLVMAWLAADEHLEVIEREGQHMHQLRSMARMILAGQTVPFCTEHRDNITPMRRAS